MWIGVNEGRREGGETEVRSPRAEDRKKTELRMSNGGRKKSLGFDLDSDPRISFGPSPFGPQISVHRPRPIFQQG